MFSIKIAKSKKCFNLLSSFLLFKFIVYITAPNKIPSEGGDRAINEGMMHNKFAIKKLSVLRQVIICTDNS